MVQCLKACPRFILPTAPSQGRTGQADQSGRVEGPLEKGNIPERAEITTRRRILFEAPAPVSQQDEGGNRTIRLAPRASD